MIKSNAQILVNYTLRVLYKISTIVLESIIAQKKNWIAIIGRYDGAFENNSMYFFKYLVNNEEFHAWWFTRSKKTFRELSLIYPNHIAYTYSIKGLLIFIKSRFAICSYSAKNFNPLFISKRKICINLWHGIPLKRIGFQDPNITGIKLKKFKEDLGFTNFLVTSSEFESELFERCFQKKHESILITGTPRNDFLLQDSNDDEIRNKELLENSRIILYAPTFRQNKKTELLPFEQINLDELNSFLLKNNAYLLIRKHHNEALRFKDLYSSGNIRERILFAGQDIYPDVQVLLKFTDILITDYSSIYFDFLLLNRPCIFVPYDYEDYIEERNFLFDYFENTPGPKLYSQPEIIHHIERYFQDNTIDEEIRINLLNKFHKYTDGKACDRIINEIKKLNH